MISVLLAAGLTVWLLGRGGGDGAEGARHPSPGTEPAPVPASGSRSEADTRRPEPEATVTASATPTATVTVTAEPTYPEPSCRDVAVRIGVRTNANAYGEGERPVFTVRVTPQRRCVLDPDELGLVASAGTQRVWSSRDCPGSDRWPLRIGPEHPYNGRVTWDRTHSNPATCGQQARPAGPGWYSLAAALGGQRSDETAFRLVSR